MIIYYSVSAQYRVDGTGTKTVTGVPKIYYKERPLWELHFVDAANTPVNLSGIAAWRAAVDRDKSSKTEPMCRSLDADIDRTRAQYGILGVRLDANTTPFLNAVDNKTTAVKSYFELWGLNAAAEPEFYACLDIEAYSVVDPDGGTLPTPVPTGLCSITEINAALVGQFPILGRLSVNSAGKLCFDGVELGQGSGEPETPDQDPEMHYGHIPPAIGGDLTSVTGITPELLAAASETVVSAVPATLGKTSLGTVPIGSFVFVLVPTASNLAAKKFDGISAKVAFSPDNGAEGTGANGTAIVLGGVSYDVYGEAMLVTGELFIYIDAK